MRKLTVILTLAAVALFLAACGGAEQAAAPAPAAPQIENGRYRGLYEDGGEQQVSIQFSLSNGNFTNISFRHLQYSDTPFRNLPEDHRFYPVFAQHLQIGEYLEGKPLAAVFDLHSPGDFIDDIDGFSGATIRGNKVFSAIRDGLNRGIY